MSDAVTALEAQLAQAATPQKRVDALNDLANEVFRVDLSQALRLFEQAYALACAPDRPYLIGQAHSRMGIGACHYALGNYGEAIANLTEALDQYRLVSSTFEQIRALSRLGTCYSALGEHDLAIEHHLQSLSLAAQHGEQHVQAEVAFRIGIAYSELGRYAEALAYYTQALGFAQSGHNRAIEGRLLNSIGVDSTNIGDYPTALEYGQRGLLIFQELQDPYGEGVALGSIGEAHVAAGQYHEALGVLAQALDRLNLRANSQHSYEVLSVIYQLGLAHRKLGQVDRAREQLDQALAGAQTASLTLLAYRCHEQLAELYEQSGDPARALGHYRQFHTIKEQAFNEASDRKVKNLEVLHRTQQARAEADRQRQLREDDRRYFEQLAQLQRDFFNAATHDLKNPLTGLSLSVDMLEALLPSDQDYAHKVITGMRDGVQRMHRLIIDFLDLAKLETGRVMVFEPAAIRPLLEAALRDHRAAADRKGVWLTLQADLDGLVATCDPAQLRRALDNLIGNAIKYTPPGGHVRVAASAKAADLHIQVIDTGLGIPAADLPHLFERFYRVRSAKHQAIEGTGLGLAIVKMIVEQHGGAVWAESDPGHGSAFHVRLPPG